ncbi:hypothetical protein MBLNU457_6455t1 [Dothideomycetes sp. NU457]
MTASWTPPGATSYAQAATNNGQAYTPVNARTTLSRPTPIMTDPPKPAAPAKVDWPQPVRDYVSRAFMADNAIRGVHKDAMSAKLKEVISAAAANNALHTIDWPTYPLPQELVRAERVGQTPTSAMSSLSMAYDTPSVVGQKRKSMDVNPTGTLPPWKQKSTSLADRVEGKDAKANDQNGKRQKKAVAEFHKHDPPSKLFDLEKRRQRFGRELAGSDSPFSSSRDDSPPPNAEDGPVVGTCQKLEKSYLRLTAPPKPETVRPLEVLKQTLDLLIRKWKDEHNYGYACDQFKSLRQDLTVQRIKTDFTVRVYEAHARIALEQTDMGEYNQCQTQLRALYKQNLGGHPGEFLAYRIFYFIYTRNRTGMNDVLADLTLTDKRHPAVAHALSVRKALAAANYHKFFRLYDECPNMGGYLLDMFVDRERIAAMAAICRAYKPDVKVSFLTEELAFTDDQQCAQFLFDTSGEQLFDNRPDGPRFLTGKAGQVFELAKMKASGVDIKGQK